jgi:hypothetical protein
VSNLVAGLLHRGDRFLASTSNKDLILLLIGLMLAAGLFVYLGMRIVHNRPESSPLRQFSRWSVETLALLMLLLVSLFWAGTVGNPIGFDSGRTLGMMFRYDYNRWSYLLPSLAWAFYILGGLLLLTRIRMPTVTFLILSVSWVFVYLGCGYRDCSPFFEEVRWMADESGAEQFFPSVMLMGGMTESAKLVLWALVPFLCGIYVARRRFAIWKVALGSLLAGWLVALVIMPVLLTMNWWLVFQPVVFTVLGLILLGIPSQRRALERLFGFPLQAGEEESLKPHSLVAVTLGHLLVVIIIVMLCALAFVAHLDRKVVHNTLVGPPPGYHNPSMRNAYPALKRRFILHEKPATRGGGSWNLPDAFNNLIFICNGGFRYILDEEGRNRCDTPKLRQALVEIAPYVDDFSSASRCDYLELPPRSLGLDLLAYREMARAMHTRATLAAYDSDTTGAIRSIESLLGFCRILRDYPNETYQMMGGATASMAEDACYQYYALLRHNPEAMDQLAHMLDTRREEIDVHLNWEALRRGVPGFWEIAPHSEITMVPVGRVELNLRRHTLRFQQLQVAVALERYRDRVGRYPDTLAKLVPDYLWRLPLDPFKGESLIYEQRGDDFTLTADQNTDTFDGILGFPPPTAEEYKKRFDEYDSQHQRVSEKTSGGSVATTVTTRSVTTATATTGQ